MSSPPASVLIPVSPAAQPSPTPSRTAAAQITQTQSAQFRKVAIQVAPAVSLISVFDSSGKLLRNGTGFFISEDGRLVTARSIVDGGAHAVAKTSDGRIHNVSGLLANGGTLDLVVLKAQPKQRVPFLPLSKNVPNEGVRVAVIGNPLTGRDPVLAEGKVARKASAQSEDFLEFSTPVPNEIGSPAVNENGEVVAVVSRDARLASGNVLRSATALSSLLAQIGSETEVGWQVASLRPSPATPAEGPSPPPRTTKIPLADPQPTGHSRLIYSPTPLYPKTASRSSRSLNSSGRFRITFARSGQVKDVSIVESTRDRALDNAAVEALRQWKAQPGQEWTANVPITFQP